jgi:hypothetical protein
LSLNAVVSLPFVCFLKRKLPPLESSIITDLGESVCAQLCVRLNDSRGISAKQSSP